MNRVLSISALSILLSISAISDTIKLHIPIDIDALPNGGHYEYVNSNRSGGEIKEVSINYTINGCGPTSIKGHEFIALGSNGIHYMKEIVIDTERSCELTSATAHVTFSFTDGSGVVALCNNTSHLSIDGAVKERTCNVEASLRVQN